MNDVNGLKEGTYILEILIKTRTEIILFKLYYAKRE